MTDTPYTLATMALAQAYRTADYAGLDAAREALLAHLRAAQAAPANFNAAWDREIANNNGVQIGADYRHWMLIGWRASRRTPEPVGHEARRRSYQEGHRDGMEEACAVVYGMAGSDNVAERTVQAIRAIATKPAQEGDHV